MKNDADIAARLTILETAVACIIATSPHSADIQALWRLIGDAFEATANASPVPDQAIAKVVLARKQLHAMVARVAEFQRQRRDPNA